MTIVGKILVILVFIMSLATGAFFVIDYSTRTNWKAAYDTLSKEMVVLQANSQQYGPTTSRLNAEAAKFRAEAENLKQRLIDEEQKAKARETLLSGQIDDANNRAKDADLIIAKAQGESDRLRLENKDLTETIKKRESLILTLEKKNQEYRNDAVANENLAKAMQDRNATLLAQVQELTKALALAQTGKGLDNRASKDPNALNPPSTYVKGTIVKVHPEDKTLVEISIGSDQGVVKNNTLEVYRMKPRPEYLGTIRVLDARHQNSVGRLMREGTTTIRQLQEGDIVATTTSGK